MPLMFDSPHEQGAIKVNGAWREQRPILEKARFHLVHVKGLHLPVEAPQFQAVELIGSGRNRVPQVSDLESNRHWHVGETAVQLV